MMNDIADRFMNLPDYIKDCDDIQPIAEVLETKTKIISRYVHPSFTLVLQQLTIDELKILYYFRHVSQRVAVLSCRTATPESIPGSFDSVRGGLKQSLPLLSVAENGDCTLLEGQIDTLKQIGFTILHHVSLIGSRVDHLQSELCEFYLENLLRLGVIAEGPELDTLKEYYRIINSNHTKSAIIKVLLRNNMSDALLCFIKESLYLTEYGRLLCDAVFEIMRQNYVSNNG